MMQRKFLHTTLVAFVTCGTLLGPLSALSAERSDTLPEASDGECYAKVSVPAVYKTEAVTTLLKEEAFTYTVAPATYVEAEERILVREASTKLIPVQPDYDLIEEEFIVSPASKSWVRGGIDSNLPASKGMLADLSGSGVDLDSAEPGQCFYEHYKPGEVRIVKEQVLVSEASEKLGVIPAEFANSEKQIMIKQASRNLVPVPPVYETVTEDILIEPAHSQWKKGRGLIERIDNTTGEIMCRVNVPARYETISKQVIKIPAIVSATMQPAEFGTLTVASLVKDAQEIRTDIPAVYQTMERIAERAPGVTKWLTSNQGEQSQFGEPTGLVLCNKASVADIKIVKRRAVATPGRFEVAEVPAVFKTVKVQKLATNAVETKVPVPAKTDSLIRRIKVSDARLEWRPVLCETNITKDIVKRIQTALNGKGYSPGPTDGLLGRGTLRAIEKFQEDQSLAQGGLTYTTIKALGVQL